MPAMFTDEWYEMVLDRAGSLPTVEGVSFIFDAEISETAEGKVRAHGRVVDGRLTELAPGKFTSPHGETSDVQFVGKAKRIEPVIRGDVDPLVAYMRGELKIDDAYERVIDHLPNRGDTQAMAEVLAAIAAETA